MPNNRRPSVASIRQAQEEASERQITVMARVLDQANAWANIETVLSSDVFVQTNQAPIQPRPSMTDFTSFAIDSQSQVSTNQVEGGFMASSFYNLDDNSTKTPVPAPAKGVERTVLYGSQVTLDFNPNSNKYRYQVWDKQGKIGDSVRGVTSILRDIVAKPDLMAWPMNMSHGAIFGSKWSEKDLTYVHDWKEAIIQPNQTYTEDELHGAMLAGARAHTARSDRGKDVGTMTHRGVELVLIDIKGHHSPNMLEIMQVVSTEYPDASEEDVKLVKKMVTKFLEWANSFRDFEVYEVERVVYSRKLNYAGTLDMVLGLNGLVYLLDLKTTNYSKKAPQGVYPDNFLQLGAYSYAFNEEANFMASEVGIVNINKSGQLNVVTSKDIGTTVDECQRAFAFALRTHDWLSKANDSLTKNVVFQSLNPLANKVVKPVAKVK